MKTPDYLTYSKYKKKKKSAPSKMFGIFLTTFFATLLIFTTIARHLSPDIDVSIGDDKQYENKTIEYGVKRFIDERLKKIQMDDLTAARMPKDVGQEEKTSENSFLNEPGTMEEEIVLPRKGFVLEEENESVKTKSNTAIAPPRPTKKELSVTYEVPKESKVYVGFYSTIEQARVAQEILIDSGLQITPFIKTIDNAYTLQIGSFASQLKAKELVYELKKYNFPARIVTE